MSFRRKLYASIYFLNGSKVILQGESLSIVIKYGLVEKSHMICVYFISRMFVLIVSLSFLFYLYVLRLYNMVMVILFCN